MELEKTRICLIVPGKKIRTDLLVPLQISPAELIRALNEAFSLDIPRGEEAAAYFKMEQPEGLLLGQDSAGTLVQSGVRCGTILIYDRKIKSEEAPAEEAPEKAIPFENHLKHPVRKISLSGLTGFSIGASQASIRLKSRFASGKMVRFQIGEQGLQIAHGGFEKGSSPEGIWLNARPVKASDLVQYGDYLWIADYVFCYKYPYLYAQQRADLETDLPFLDPSVHEAYPVLSRTTRICRPAKEEPIEILNPPPKKEFVKRDLLSRLVPSAGFILMGLLMALLGGRSFLVFACAQGLIGFLSAGFFVYAGRRNTEQENEIREEQYRAYLQEKQLQIEGARRDEKRILEQWYLSSEEELRRIGSFSPLLFDRNPGDPDFLHLRLGTGPVKARRTITTRPAQMLSSEDGLSQLPMQLAARCAFLLQSPVTIDLTSNPLIGIAGPSEDQWLFLKHIVLDLAARHSPRDVRFLLIGRGKDLDQVQLFRFLPHFLTDEGACTIAVHEDSRRRLMQYLYQQQDQQNMTGETDDVWMIVFVREDLSLLSHPVYRLQNRNICYMFFQDEESKLPPACRSVIRLLSREGELISPHDDHRQCFSFPFITDEQIRSVSSLLAPVEIPDCSLEKSLPQKVALFDILPLSLLHPEAIVMRWLSAHPEESLAVPVGISRQGVTKLDLSDHSDGPHGLIAGTTGSGKSEWLLTFILCVCASFHPYDAGFLIIDFKGGSTADRLKALPHIRGVLTNLDNGLLNRSLIQIQAEVKMRQEAFSAAGVNHIDDYIRLYKNHQTARAIPHLIIVVDEFAELKAQRPEFMKALISVSRIGRSLGIHLLLATQKPAGQIDDQIWSNTRFKICLKVQSRADSNEVLHSPLAAEIREPGRAILKIGEDEIFELFQSAYAGAAFRDEGEGRAFLIEQVGQFEQKKCVFQSEALKQRKDGAGVSTQMDKLVNAINLAFSGLNITRPGLICLPPLEEIIRFPLEKADPEQQPIADGREQRIRAAVGMMDLPREQAVKDWVLEPGAGNVLAVGDSGMGKTNYLKTLLSSLCMQYSPEKIALYVLDFDTSALLAYAKLPQVGDVLSIRDEEKLWYLESMLEKQMRQRRAYLAACGVSSWQDLPENHPAKMPQIVLLVDQFSVWKELRGAFKEGDSFLLNLLRDGPGLGISIVATGTGTLGISFRELSLFTQRIVFYCTDQGDYAQLLGSTRVKLEQVPGRALLSGRSETLKAQCWLAPDCALLLGKIKGADEAPADRIPMVPDAFRTDFLYQHAGQLPEGWIAGGLVHETLEPWLINPFELGLMGMCGERMLCEGYAGFLLQSLLEKTEYELHVYVSDSADHRMEKLKDFLPSVTYTDEPQHGASFLLEIEEKLAKMQHEVRQKTAGGRALYVMISDDEEWMEETGKSLKVREACRNILGKYRRLGVLMLVVLPNRPLFYAQDEIRARIRETRQILCFEALRKLRLFDLPASRRNPREERKSRLDAWYVNGQEVQKIRVPDESLQILEGKNIDIQPKLW